MTDTALTQYVASFITNTAFRDLPAHALAMSKKSFLDGIGLAFAGSVAESGTLIRRHLDSLSLGAGPSTVIGGDRKIAPRFAAFANIPSSLYQCISRVFYQLRFIFVSVTFVVHYLQCKIAG